MASAASSARPPAISSATSRCSTQARGPMLDTSGAKNQRLRWESCCPNSNRMWLRAVSSTRRWKEAV